MKYLIAAGLCAAGLVLGAAQPSEAATSYPWCARYGGYDNAGDTCGFVSYRQCMATVSGTGGLCVRNTNIRAMGAYRGHHRGRHIGRYR